MRVILKSDIPNLGRAGDIKEVKNGYARNYLIPRGMVMTADARSQKERVFLENVRQRKIAKRKKTAEELAGALNGYSISFLLKAGEEGKLFGSVTSMAIAKKLEEDGHMVDKKVIQLDEPIKTTGTHNVDLKLYEGVTTTIKVTVEADMPEPEEVIDNPALNEENEAQESPSGETSEEATQEN